MEKKKKILVFHHSGAIGGGGISMLHILKTLKKCEYDIKVICPDEPEHMLNEIKKLGIKADGVFDKNWVYPHYNGQHYNILDPRYQRKWQYIKSSYEKVIQIIDDENPDIVMFNSMTITWMEVCIDKSIKTICFDRETLPKNGQGRRCDMIKRWLKSMTKSVYLSEYDRTNAGNHKNSLVITDKVDMSKFEDMIDKTNAKCALELDFDRKYILYAGGMWKIKGAHTALQMMHCLSNDYGLIFLQYTPQKRSGSFKSKVKRLLKMDYEGDTLKLLSGIEDRVKFFPPQKEMIPFYSACDIVIFPSVEPHQARPVYEAGAALKPAVISDFDNTKEFAKDKVNVLTFKEGDAKALASCIEKLEDKELYYKLADNGYKMCKNNHNIKDMENEIKEMLENIED